MKLLSRFSALLLSAAIFSFTSCGDGEASTDSDGKDSDTTAATAPAAVADRAEATIAGTLVDSVVRGTASFVQEDGGKVTLQLQIMVPSKANSTVAVHIHQNGSCNDTANAAGPHWSPSNTQHGQVGSGNVHPGDFGNIKINAEGRGEYTFTSDHWTIGGDTATNILDRAIVVHGGVDDLKTQPSGNSGPRIGCGVIRRASGSQP